MAKVILLDSPSWKLFDPTMHLNLGILYLAGSLRAAGHDVKVMDSHHGVTSWNKEDDKLTVIREALEPCDVLGLSATTANVHWGSQLAEAWPAKFKVLGGPHASHIINGPHERFKDQRYFKSFDYLMVDECEESFVKFCDAVGKGKDPKTNFVPGLVWWDVLGRHMLGHSPLPDVTKLPPPAFDLWASGFHAGGLAGPTHRSKNAGRLMTASLYTMRGCPYGCTFCADARTAVRGETFEQIEHQVMTLEGLGVKAIRIQDDTFTIQKERAKAIADIMQRHDMVWRGTTRVNLVDRDLFSYLSDRGCAELGFGVEHGSARMLKAMQKGTTPDKNEKSLRACRDAGIVARCFLMIGFPGETRESIQEMKDWILRAQPDACTLSLFTPYPGSDVWNNPGRYGVKLPDDAFARMWQLGMDDDPEAIVLDLPTMSKMELFEARQDMIEFLEREVGSLDRRKMGITAEKTVRGKVGLEGPGR